MKIRSLANRISPFLRDGVITNEILTSCPDLEGEI